MEAGYMVGQNFSRAFSVTSSPNVSNVTTPGLIDVTADDDASYYKWNFGFSVILAALLSIAAFLAVVGNSMVLTVVIRHRGMRTRTNLFLVNLAVADLLVGAAVVPFAITTLIEGRWIFGSYTGTFCTINGWLNCFCLVASIHTLMYISVHKHYSITHPLSSHFALRQILGMMAAAWVWAAVSSTITVTGLSSVRYKMGTTQCGPEYPHGLKSYIFHAIIQVTNIFIPVIILIYCYTRMFRAIRAHSRRLQQNSTLEQDIILAQQKKVTITLFIVLAAFIVCALPFHLYATYATISSDKHFSPYLNPVAYGSLYLNSALNPIIYAFRSPSFREGYKEILCQTPTYVISDDLAGDELSPLRRRFSSFLSSFWRTTSMTSFKERTSIASLTSLAGQGGPAAVFPPGGKRPRGLAEAMRASRKLGKQSSVVRHNGDVIIVKAGKIVSIRRQDTLPALPLPAGPGPLPNGLGTGEGAGGTNGHAVSGERAPEGMLPVPAPPRPSSQGSDDVFGDGEDGGDGGDWGERRGPGHQGRRLLARQTALDEGGGWGDTDVDCQPGGGDRRDLGIIINIDDDNSIVKVTPLTPGTRDRLTRSDLFLSQDEGVGVGAVWERRVEGSLSRLPSVEHLDPPGGPLHRCSSDYSMQTALRAATRLVNPSPTPPARRKS